MNAHPRGQRGNAATIVLLVLFLGVGLIGPIFLHLTQKRHNALASVEQRYPAGEKHPSGEIFAGTLAEIVRHELEGSTGWRPNDFFLWGPGLWADNNSNRQLGIAQAARRTATVFKDHLTKISSNEYDPNLVRAEAALHNEMEKFWFPSAESKLQEGVDALEAYIAGLKSNPPRSRGINARNVELIRLFQAWGDMLGDAHANLYKEYEADGDRVAMTRNDDYFYHAQGFAHVIAHMTRAVKREYAVDLENRPSVGALFDEVASALQQAALLKPLIVFDGSLDGLRANHRRNLDAFIVEARQKIYSIREELEK